MKQILGTKYIVNEDGSVIGTFGRVLKPKIAKTGYQEISIYIDGKPKTWLVHRLVATCYIPNPMNKPFVNHKDGVKTNNCVENLEWVTHQENMEHAKNNRLVWQGEDNANSTITDEQAEEICKLLEYGLRNIDIRKQFNISKTIVASIRAGDSWKHISCKYNIPKRSRSLSQETVHWICSKLQEGLTRGQILKLTDNKLITKHMIQGLIRRDSYKDIVCLYNY